MRRSEIQMRLHSGVTLIELVVVIAIVGILFGIGSPSYRYITNSNRMSSEVNALLGDMQYTRSEAVREGRRVVICISSNGTSCAGGMTNTWQSGWIVFSDVNSDGAVSGTEPVLRVQTAFSGTDVFKDSAGTLTQVSFNREGFAIGLPNAVSLLVLRDSTANQAWTRCLSITLVGMLATQTHVANAGCT
jgi:type IV fimbrial biogenesis protein FimT